MAKPLGYLFSFIYSFTDNYLVVVLAAALAFNILLFGFDILKARSVRTLTLIVPEVLRLREKYPNAEKDKDENVKLKEEITKVYNAHNYTGAMNFILPIVNIIAVIFFYYVAMNPLTFICGFSQDTITAIKELMISAGVEMGRNIQFEIINYFNEYGGALFTEAMPQIANISMPSLTVFGFNVGVTPSFSWPTIMVPIAMTATSILVTLLEKAKAMIASIKNHKATDGVNKEVLTTCVSCVFTIVFTMYIASRLPIVICMYWMFVSVFSPIKGLIAKKICSTKKNLERNVSATLQSAAEERKV